MTEQKSCKTKYPILLLHGLNSRDGKPFFCFGRIPDTLRSQGARVYLGGQDAWGTIESNALQIKKRIETILATEHCNKVNIIAHSKGGLEARYLVSALMQQDKIASISTIATPHYGTKTVEKWAAYKDALRVVGFFFNFYSRILGDQSPSFVEAVQVFVPEYMRRFNENYRDSPSVYYQSWGTSMNDSREDRTMRVLRHIFYRLDGENDGLVSPNSARWTNYQGTIENISHQDIVDCRKKNLKHFSTTDFYIQVAQKLVEKGF